MNLLGQGLCLLGAVVLLIAAWGVVRLPDALSRQHAATKAGTLALFAFILGAGLLMPEPAWLGRLALLLIVLLLTLPIASHALARAALRRMLFQENFTADHPTPTGPDPQHESIPVVPGTFRETV